MDKTEFKNKLEACGLKKADFASILGLGYSTVNNWGTSSEFPRWVETWLDNFLLARQARQSHNNPSPQVTVHPFVKDALMFKRDKIIEILADEIAVTIFNQVQDYKDGKIEESDIYNVVKNYMSEEDAIIYSKLVVKDMVDFMHQSLDDKLDGMFKHSPYQRSAVEQQIIQILSKNFSLNDVLRKIISMLKI